MLTRSKLDKYHLWVHLRQTYGLLYGCEQDFHSKSNITGEQFSVLWNIKYITETKRSPVILSDLAAIVLRNMNSVSEIVNRMEKAGLVKKYKDLPDRRATRIEITPKGEKIFYDNAIPNLKFVDKLFSPLTDKEALTFLKLIKKLRKWMWQDFNIDKSKVDPVLDDPANIDKFLDKLF
jgi:MarR family transcriptional regulator, organic hydroperoxide resistance regulator